MTPTTSERNASCGAPYVSASPACCAADRPTRRVVSIVRALVARPSRHRWFAAQVVLGDYEQLASPAEAVGARSAACSTAREQQVLEQIAAGASVADAAERLGLPATTAANLVANALRKLQRWARASARARMAEAETAGELEAAGRPRFGAGPSWPLRTPPVDSSASWAFSTSSSAPAKARRSGPCRRWCPRSTRSSPRSKALSDDALRAKTGEFRQRLDNGETLDDLLIEAFAVTREAARPGDRPAPLRRAADGRRRAALRLGRRDEDRRGQDPRVDAAGLPQRPRRQGRPPHHGERLPGHPRRRVDGPDPPLARPRPSASSSPATTTRTHKRAAVRAATSPTARTTSSASTTSATTWR